ncbi:MAG TPA: hypothetical protein VIG98_01840 [Bacillus sp. (in: firmicutes)]
MGDWNEQGAPNNNLSAATIRTSKMVGKEGIQSEEFSEELSDGGERNEIISKQLRQRKPGRSSSK